MAGTVEGRPRRQRVGKRGYVAFTRAMAMPIRMTKMAAMQRRVRISSSSSVILQFPDYLEIDKNCHGNKKKKQEAKALGLAMLALFFRDDCPDAALLAGNRPGIPKVRQHGVSPYGCLNITIPFPG